MIHICLESTFSLTLTTETRRIQQIVSWRRPKYRPREVGVMVQERKPFQTG